ncbi:MAG TPA: hypothetical protein VFJ02_11630 [Vicinamibacterales bacterium]|nr:hypothetical protein [Vicinamibacterales bacterium]
MTFEPEMTPSPCLRNLSSAGRVEIFDASRRRVLHGELEPVGSAIGATLKSAQLTGANRNAVGKEVEVTRRGDGLLVQELEIDVNGLASEGLFSVLIDGEPAGVFRTDLSGGAELEHYGRVNDLPTRSGD